ncbi:hypothetical protein QMA67_05835 [Gluconobacter japonicus]|uniref:MFS transporter n=1 Tax=Gluconobacter japonicus TaxID=376620 RepID=UPI0031F65137|nr:hypothetical protein [Gluconobacter japonicus]
MQYSSADDAGLRRKREISHILSLSLGNGLEYYNFALYAFFAPFIGETFFDLGSNRHTLLPALIVFGSGFLFRPLGAFLMGRMALKRGEASTLALTFLLMGAASVGFVLLPGAHQIGILAPILVFVLRAVQGFAEGGEIGPATQMLYAASSGPGQVFNTTLQYITQYVAMLIAAFLGTLVSAELSEHAMASWGWRIPFLLGGVVVIFGLRLRFQDVKGSSAPQTQPPQSAPSQQSASTEGGFLTLTAALILCVVSASAFTTYVRSFGVSYAMGQLHATALTSLLSMTIGVGAGLLAMIMGIILYHRVSRRFVLIATIVLTEILVLPVYLLCIKHPSFLTLAVLNAVTYWLSGITSAISIMTVLRAIPAGRRSLVFGMLYTIAVSIFGGLAQPVMQWAINCTGWQLLPAFATMVSCPAGLLSLLVLLGRSQEPDVSQLGASKLDQSCSAG